VETRYGIKYGCKKFLVKLLQMIITTVNFNEDSQLKESVACKIQQALVIYSKYEFVKCVF
jgi:hypothetical protein